MSNLATITNNILADSGIDDINVIVSTGSYANPAWITSLAWTKITGAPLGDYLPLAGGTMTGNINWAQTDRGLTWAFNTDGASIKFYNTSDAGTDSRLEFATLDNDNEYFRWVHIPSGGSLYESMRLVPNSSGNAQLFVNGNIAVSSGTSIAKLQVGNNTFGSANGFASDNNRLGIMLNGSLTSYVYASTYNDPGFPDYGFVFIHGPNTSSYNVWSISPDGPARGSGLHFIYQANSANIHSQPPMMSLVGSTGRVGISTINPLARLQVGNGTQTALNGAGNKIHIATNDTRSALLTLANSSGGTTVEGQFESSAESADLRVIIGSTSNHDVSIRANNTERVRIFAATGDASFTSSIVAQRYSSGNTNAFVNVAYAVRGVINGNNDSWGIYQNVVFAPIANNALAVSYHAGGASSVNRGTFTGLSYRGFYHENLGANTGTGTLQTAYGVYIDALTRGVSNYSAYFAQNVGIGTVAPVALLEVSATQPDITITSTSTSQYSRLVFRELTSELAGVEYINSSFSEVGRRSKLEVFTNNGIHLIPDGSFNAPVLSLLSTGSTFRNNLGVGGAASTYPLTVFNGSNGTTAAIGGTARGLRVDNDGVNSVGMTSLFGVDNSFYGSYQPIRLAGSVVYLGIGHTNNVVTIDAAGLFTIGTDATTGTTELLRLRRNAGGWGNTTFKQSYNSTYFTNGKTLTLANDSNTDFAHFPGNNAGTITDFILPTGGITASGSVRANGLLIGDDRLYMPGNQPISNWFSSSLTIGYSSSNSYGWINGAGNLIFGTSGVEQVRLNSGGNLGINNTNPQNRLTVNTPLRQDGETNSLGALVVAGPISSSPSNDFTNSTAIFRIQGSNATNNLQFGVGGDGYSFHPWIQGSFDNTPSGSPTFGSKDILMQPLGGNVGIGAISFADVSFGAPILKLEGSRATLALTSSGSLCTIAMTPSNNTGLGIHLNQGNDGSFRWYQYSVGSETFTLAGNGNVGIRNDSPQAYLDIRGVADQAGFNNLVLRSGNSDDSVPESNQILFGYANTMNYAHAIKTRHQSGSPAGNSIEFWVWKYGDAISTQAGQRVMVAEGNGVRVANSAGALINPVDSSVLTVNGNGYFDGTIRTGTLTSGAQTASVPWRLGNARGGTATANALVRVQINGVLVDLIGNYV
jgi:hypothetical protein